MEVPNYLKVKITFLIVKFYKKKISGMNYLLIFLYLRLGT